MLFLGKYPYGNPISVMNNRPVREHSALNQKKSYIQLGSARWDIMITLQPITVGAEEAANEIESHIMRHSDRSSFEIPMPQRVIAPVTQSVSVAAEYSVFQKNIAITDGAELPIGLYISFANHRKVYRIVDTYVQDRVGTFITLEPGLHERVLPNELINTAPMVRVNYKNNQQFGFKTDNDGTWKPVLNLQELPFD